MNDDSIKCHMVGVDGKVRLVPAYLKDELLKKGFRVVINPKAEYYPNLDQTLKSNTPPNQIDNLEESEVLEIEKI